MSKRHRQQRMLTIQGEPKSCKTPMTARERLEAMIEELRADLESDERVIDLTDKTLDPYSINLRG